MEGGAKKDAAFLPTVGSFLLTVELFYLQLTLLASLLTVGAFLLTILAFFAYSWSFFAYSGFRSARSAEYGGTRCTGPTWSKLVPRRPTWTNLAKLVVFLLSFACLEKHL